MYRYVNTSRRASGGRKAYLNAVDELGERDIRLVTEDGDSLEGTRAVTELEAQEITVLRWSPSTELDGQSRGVVGYCSRVNGSQRRK